MQERNARQFLLLQSKFHKYKNIADGVSDIFRKRKMIDLQKSLLLYAVTDHNWEKNNNFLSDIEYSLANGVTFLQLREKNISTDAYISIAKDVKKLCKKYNVPFVINDNLNVALNVNADALHIGQEDGNIKTIRSQLPHDVILGVSAQTVEQALQAERDGADYLGVGAIFSTSTKKDAKSVSLENLKNICKAVKIPVVAIGGINTQNIKLLEHTGIAGVALVSAIYGAKNIPSECKRILQILKEANFQ